MTTDRIRKVTYLLFLACAFLGLSACANSAGAGDYDAFFRAARNDDAGSMRHVLADGFDPNIRDKNGLTGLMIAIREPAPKVAMVLAEFPKTDVDALNAAGESALMLAAIKGDKELVAKLIERDAAVNKPGWAPLHYAASSGQVEIMHMLLDHYAFIDAQSPNGTTPLMMAAMYGTTPAVKLLLEEGADPTMKNQLGLNAADFGQRANRPDAVELINAAVRARQTAPAAASPAAGASSGAAR